MELPDRVLVEDLCAIDHGLSGATIDFIESIAAWVEGGKALTSKQREVAEKIWEEHYG